MGWVCFPFPGVFIPQSLEGYHPSLHTCTVGMHQILVYVMAQGQSQLLAISFWPLVTECLNIYFKIMQISSRTEQTWKCCQWFWKHIMFSSQMPGLCCSTGHVTELLGVAKRVWASFILQLRKICTMYQKYWIFFIMYFYDSSNNSNSTDFMFKRFLGEKKEALILHFAGTNTDIDE